MCGTQVKAGKDEAVRFALPPWVLTEAAYLISFYSRAPLGANNRSISPDLPAGAELKLKCAFALEYIAGYTDIMFSSPPTPRPQVPHP